jgi:hypothetical protein
MLDYATLCHDCGTDTTPCTGRRGCRHKQRWEWYMVHASVWRAAGMPRMTVETGGGFLCIGCLERRLGRNLNPTDFTDAPVNNPSPWDTPRLAAGKAGTRRGRAASQAELW